MKRTDSPLWKQAATPDERAEIQRLDREIAKLRKQMRKLSGERNFLANRATVRARYEQRGGRPAAGHLTSNQAEGFDSHAPLQTP